MKNLSALLYFFAIWISSLVGTYRNTNHMDHKSTPIFFVMIMDLSRHKEKTTWNHISCEHKRLHFQVFISGYKTQIKTESIFDKNLFKEILL